MSIASVSEVPPAEALMMAEAINGGLGNTGAEWKMTAWEGGVVSMSVTSGSTVGWKVKLPDAMTMLVGGIAVEVMGCPVKIGGLMVATARGVGKYKGGGESTQMGVGGSFSRDGGWKEEAGMLGGGGGSEVRQSKHRVSCFLINTRCRGRWRDRQDGGPGIQVGQVGGSSRDLQSVSGRGQGVCSL